MGALPVGLPARYADGPGDPSARTTAEFSEHQMGGRSLSA